MYPKSFFLIFSSEFLQNCGDGFCPQAAKICTQKMENRHYTQPYEEKRQGPFFF